MRNTRSEAANAMFVKAAAQARDISVLYLLTISKRYQQPVDIVGVGGVHVAPGKVNQGCPSISGDELPMPLRRGVGALGGGLLRQL